MAVLIPEQELPPDKAATTTTDTPAGVGRADLRSIIVDPYQGLIGQPRAWIDARFDPSDAPTRLDLPYDDAAALHELLETLFVLDGWASVDQVVQGADRALAWTLLAMYPIGPLASALPGSRSAGVHYSPAPADPLAAARALVAAVAKGWPMPAVLQAATLIQNTPKLFDQDLPRVVIDLPGIAPELPWVARAQANIVLALTQARRQLADRVRRAAWRVEREATRQLRTSLTDAYASLVRETRRYFPVQLDGAAALLASPVDFRSMRVTAASAAGPEVLDEAPAALQRALKELKPLASRVVLLEGTSEGTPTPAAMVRAARARSRAVLAREVGRRADAFPVLPRLTPEQICQGADASAAVLGEVVLPVLRRCYTSNRKMQSRAAGFIGVADVYSTDPRPERALADKVAGAGTGHSVWDFPKYVQRGTERVASARDVFTRRVVEMVDAQLATSDAPAVAALTQAGAETAAVGAAQALASTTMDRAMQRAMGQALVLGLAERAAVSLLPVINIATATWHIATAISDFGKQKDEFYCTLDPRDALIEAAPSFNGLILDIATEAVFALI